MAEETLTDPTTGGDTGETGGGTTEPTTPETPKPEDKVVSISVAESMFTQFGEALPGYIQGNMDQIDSNRLIPAGGTQGQTLVKKSDADYDTNWATVDARPAAIYTTFDAGSGKFPTTSSSMVTIEQTPNTPVSMPTESPRSKGYTFAGWFMNLNDDVTQVTETTIVTWEGSNVVYAKWSAISYNVTLSANYSSGINSYTTAEYGQNMSSVPVPTREGYTFTGYYDDVISGTMYYNQNGDSVKKWDISGDTTLYAHWKKNVTAGDQLQDYTWDELGNLTNNAADKPEDFAYMIGQTTSIALEGFGTVTLQLIGVGHDALADGSGKSGFTFQCSMPMTTRIMGTGATWEASDIRSWLNTTVFEAMPADLKKNIKPVKKKYNESGTVKECSDSLYLISWSELTGATTYGSEGTMYQYWAEHSSDSDRVKSNGWWTRTYSGGNVVYVNETGTNASSSPMVARGVSFCFSLGGDATTKTLYDIEKNWDTPAIWQTLSDAADDVRQHPWEYDKLIGRKLNLTHNLWGEQTVRIIDICHDVKQDGTLAAFTFDFEYIVETRKVHSESLNTTDTSYIPFEKLDLHKYLNEDFYNGFPDEIKNLITPVEKRYNGSETEGGASDNLGDRNNAKYHKIVSNIWIPSAEELFNCVSPNQSNVVCGSVYKHYADLFPLKTLKNDTGLVRVWIREMFCQSSSWYSKVFSVDCKTQNFGSDESRFRADDELYIGGVCPMFCIG